MSIIDNKRPCSVLLAEDNKINQKLVLLMLGKLRVESKVAGTGIEAVELAKAHDFDLILMDLHMPVMGGLEATQALKAHFGDACPPVVALTADAVVGSETEALKKGLDGYLIKPINTERLRQCINEHTVFQL